MRYKRNQAITMRLRDENILVSIGRELADEDKNGSKIDSIKIKTFFKRRQYDKKRD